MTTRAALRGLVRLALSDPEQTAGLPAWPDATLNAWLAAAIRLYSAHSPRRCRQTLALSAGTQAYDLPAGTVAVVTVEYPTGRTPPEYIPYAHPDSSRFLYGASCYTLRGLPARPAPTDRDHPGQVLFAETISAGQTADIEYLAEHPVPEEDEDVLSVPDRHLAALTAYCGFAAAAALEADAALATTAETIVLSQLGEAARRAWNRYRDVMDRLTWLGTPDLPVAPPRWEQIGLARS